MEPARRVPPVGFWGRLEVAREAWRLEPPPACAPAPWREAGDRAEELVASLAHELSSTVGGCFSIRNLRIPEDLRRARAEVDLIILSPSCGVICIEVKHWSGKLRCERGRWLQYGTPDAGRRNRPSSGSSGTYGPGLTNLAAARPGAFRSHPYDRDPAAAREYKNPVAEIRRKAELVRAYLVRVLPSAQGVVLAQKASVQAFVLLTAACDIEVAAGDSVASEEFHTAVVQRGDVPAFIHRLRDQRHWLKALVDPVLPAALSTPGVAELVAAKEALLQLGTWDLLELRGRTLRGDLRIEGRLGVAIAELGSRARVAEVRFWHGGDRNASRLRRTVRALWEGEVLCSAEIMLRKWSSLLEWVTAAWGITALVPENEQVRIREAGQADFTVVSVAEIERLVLSCV